MLIALRIAIVLAGVGCFVWVANVLWASSYHISIPSQIRVAEEAPTPDIGVDLRSLQATLSPGNTDSRTITISNEGGADLVWILDEDPAVPWLLERPTSAIVSAGASIEIQVTFDSTGLPRGTYKTALNIDSNDLDENRVLVPVSLTVPPGVCGDLNNDGEVDIRDAFMNLRIAVGRIKATDEQKMLGDVTGPRDKPDGQINILDAIAILRYVVGLTEITECGPLPNNLIEITEVPPFGLWPAYLRGRVHESIDPIEHGVACYIEVEGGWWTKPTFASPTVAIRSEGTWECLTTTGGIDEQATEMCAFLLRAGDVSSSFPPRVGGAPELPQGLYDGALDQDCATRTPSFRAVQFSGYEWRIKTSRNPAGPGPNFFSDSEENVWVDASGHLHLRITNREGKWFAAEVILAESFGHGQSRFYLNSRIDQLNENVVVGLFTWDTAPLANHREMDIEFTRWSNPGNPNAQFTVQPAQTKNICPTDGLENICRFQIQLDEEDHRSLHVFNWQGESIHFQSFKGHDPMPGDEKQIIKEWTYFGEDNPPPGNENIRINLWLNEGRPPSDGQEVEVVITKFEFVP